MNEQEHKERHVLLHKCFDELLADYLLHHPGEILSSLFVMDVVEWSGKQQKVPELFHEGDMHRT